MLNITLNSVLLCWLLVAYDVPVSKYGHVDKTLASPLFNFHILIHYTVGK